MILVQRKAVWGVGRSDPEKGWSYEHKVLGSYGLGFGVPTP